MPMLTVIKKATSSGAHIGVRAEDDGHAEHDPGDDVIEARFDGMGQEAHGGGDGPDGIDHQPLLGLIAGTAISTAASNRAMAIV